MSNSLLEHCNKVFERTANQQQQQQSGQRDNIWFDWGNSDEHVVRLVGEFKSIKTHWIGDSKFGKDISILKPSAFTGDNKIPMNVACGNWDVKTESENPDHDGCPICRLGHNADQMLQKYGSELEEGDKEIFKAIRKKCMYKESYLFKCIDRSDPYVDNDKTRKGYKIIRMPKELLTAIFELSKKLRGVNVTSPDEGIDITIKRQVPANGQRGRTTYTALPVYDGMTVKQTPLTEEELAYQDIDLLKFAGRPIDSDRFLEELVDENNVRATYENSLDSGSPF